MGWFDSFIRKPTPARIDKMAKRMLNEHHQQQVRQESLDELVSYGTPEAIRALLQRLGVNFRDTIVNEQEKNWVSDTIVEQFAEESIGPLVDFVMTEQTISAAIRTLARLIGEERLTQVCLDALRARDPKDHRTIAARVQLVDALSDLSADEIVDALMPNLADHDDDVRVKVIETLETRVAKAGKVRKAPVAEGLVEVLKDPLASGRITRRAAEALANIDADVGTHALELTDVLPDGWAIDERGRLRAP